MPLNLAMDGPVGAGKSTVADAVAARLGILHLDTGAMYRAIGLLATRRDVPLTDEDNFVQSAALKLGFAMLLPSAEYTRLGDFAAGSSLLFEYSPPGASNLPVNFILLPAEN